MTLRRVEQVHNTTTPRHVPNHARTERVGPVRGMPGHGVKNATVAAVRFGWPRSERKQSGRRYGPAPRRAPKLTASAPTPIGSLLRLFNYTDQNDTDLTARQNRQYKRMQARETFGVKAENRRARGRSAVSDAR